MKKSKANRYIAVFLLVAVVIGVMLIYAPKPFSRHLSDFPQTAKVSVYCRKTDLPSVNMGNGYLVQCTVADVRKTLDLCRDVDGISVSFSATRGDFDAILKRFNVREVSCYSSGALVAVCGRSNKVLGGVNLNGETVNIQVAFDGSTLTVGYPLILDSY